jgi:hypothetical protein
LTCLVSSLYKKFRIDPTFEFMSVLVVPKDSEIVFENLLGKCNSMLRGNLKTLFIFLVHTNRTTFVIVNNIIIIFFFLMYVRK